MFRFVSRLVKRLKSVRTRWSRSRRSKTDPVDDISSDDAIVLPPPPEPTESFDPETPEIPPTMPDPDSPPPLVVNSEQPDHTAASVDEPQPVDDAAATPPTDLTDDGFMLVDNPPSVDLGSSFGIPSGQVDTELEAAPEFVEPETEPFEEPEFVVGRFDAVKIPEPDEVELAVSVDDEPADADADPAFNEPAARFEAAEFEADEPEIEPVVNADDGGPVDVEPEPEQSEEPADFSEGVADDEAEELDAEVLDHTAQDVEEFDEVNGEDWQEAEPSESAPVVTSYMPSVETFEIASSTDEDEDEDSHDEEPSRPAPVTTLYMPSVETFEIADPMDDEVVAELEPAGDVEPGTEPAVEEPIVDPLVLATLTAEPQNGPEDDNGLSGFHDDEDDVADEPIVLDLTDQAETPEQAEADHVGDELDDEESDALDLDAESEAEDEYDLQTMPTLEQLRVMSADLDEIDAALERLDSEGIDAFADDGIVDVNDAGVDNDDIDNVDQDQFPPADDVPVVTGDLPG